MDLENYSTESLDSMSKLSWLLELNEIIERGNKYLDMEDTLEEYDLVSLCREFTEKMDEVTIRENVSDNMDRIAELGDNAKDAIISYYLNNEEESAKETVKELVSIKNKKGQIGLGEGGD